MARSRRQPPAPQRPAPQGRTLSAAIAGQPGYDVELLWYLLLRKSWSCLAVVSPDHAHEKVLRLARSLSQKGERLGRSISALDALDIDLSRAAAVTNQVAPRGAIGGGEQRYIIALDPPLANPLAIGVLAACDAVLIALELGVTGIANAQRTVEIIGREQILGAVLLRG